MIDRTMKKYSKHRTETVDRDSVDRAEKHVSKLKCLGVSKHHMN